MFIIHVSDPDTKVRGIRNWQTSILRTCYPHLTKYLFTLFEGRTETLECIFFLFVSQHEVILLNRSVGAL